MSKFYCITDLIQFIMKEEENLVKGSVHEDDLMTEKETIKWIK